MTSNRPLNSKDALEERTATSSSVILSGARREKVGLDINDNSRSPGNSHPTEVGSQRADFILRLTQPPSQHTHSKSEV